MSYPRFPHGQDGDDVSQQELVTREDILDDTLRDAEASMLGHFSDPGAHPQINSRFAPASHTSDEARHIGAGEIAVPAPPTSGGRVVLQHDPATGVTSWVPFP